MRAERARPGQTHRREHGGEDSVIGAGRGRCQSILALDQANVASPRSFGRFLGRELHALPLAKQLEHGVPHRAAVKKVFDPGFIPDESEALVDQQTCDRTRRHTVLRFAEPPESRPGKPPHHGTRGICVMRPKMQAFVAV